MTALISKGQQNKRGRDVPVLLGVELRDAREEVFTILVCDGLPFGLAFKRAGFTSKDNNAPSNLFNLPRVQERARVILEARKATGAVSLSEVTSMLQRVYAGAHAAEEFSAAHNAALSLARIYGHVTDRATLEVIRRPSRDPDAPSEQALASWVNDLPTIEHAPQISGSNLPLPSAPASLLGMPRDNPSTLSDNPPTLSDNPPTLSDNLATPRDSQDGNSNEIKWLNRDTTVGGRPENGAPSRPVTGTPDARAHSELLGPGPQEERGPPPNETGTSTPTGGKNAGPRRLPDRQIPSFEELFG